MKNREIKFRCWNEKEETMVFFDLALCSDESGRWWDEEIKDNPIMQYTGLKDKNGVEIYEGDIVRIKVPQDDEDPLITHGVFEVVFAEGFFCLLIDGVVYPLWDYLGQEEEVIGNIYEDYELLNF